MSRVIERKMVLGEAEKAYWSRLLRRVQAFCGMEVLTHCVMSNHFHVLVYVPEQRTLSDAEVIARMKHLYSKVLVREFEEELRNLRKQGLNQQAEACKARYTYRMGDLSEFIKTLKQRFTQWYNRNHDRKGTLWEERFKSVLVEPPSSTKTGERPALLTLAAYIDLNPVRAGLVEDPKAYRYSGYGEAVSGHKGARIGLNHILEGMGQRGDWAHIQAIYRKHLYITGEKSGLTSEEVSKVLAQGGKLDAGSLMRCKVRYFADGVALGSKGFVEGIFRKYRDQFGYKRKTGARALRGGAWGGLCTMRDLRKEVLTVSTV